MSVRRYRMYLMVILLALGVAAGVVVYVYYKDGEKQYRDGTLVQNVYLLEEALS